MVHGSQSRSRIPLAPAKELLEYRPDLIIANSTPSLAAFKDAPHTIPIVFIGVADPVAQGFVSNMGRLPNDPEAEKQIVALRRGLESFGWFMGRNLAVEYRWHSGDAGVARALAKELLEYRPDLIIANSTPSLAAFKDAPRLGRSLIDLLGTIQTLEACNVDLYLDQQAIDTTTPAGKLMFQVTGAFAEFERGMIKQRIHAGLKRAVEAGKQLGRPRIPAQLEKRIQNSIASQERHACGGQGVWCRYRHGSAYCARDG